MEINLEEVEEFLEEYGVLLSALSTVALEVKTAKYLAEQGLIEFAQEDDPCV